MGSINGIRHPHFPPGCHYAVLVCDWAAYSCGLDLAADWVRLPKPPEELEDELSALFPGGPEGLKAVDYVLPPGESLSLIAGIMRRHSGDVRGMNRELNRIFCPGPPVSGPDTAGGTTKRR